MGINDIHECKICAKRYNNLFDYMFCCEGKDKKGSVKMNAKVNKIFSKTSKVKVLYYDNDDDEYLICNEADKHDNWFISRESFENTYGNQTDKIEEIRLPNDDGLKRLLDAYMIYGTRDKVIFEMTRDDKIVIYGTEAK